MTVAGADAATRIKQRNAGIYLVKETLVETPWYGLYRGAKVFRNVLPTQELKETDESEHLDVLLKTIAYTRLDDREYVKARRDQVRFEMRRVLGCGATNLLPEPIDYFETENTLDPFTFGRAAQLIRKEPILVFENISGHVLAKWMRTESPSLRRRLHVATEILGFMQTLHGSKLIANNLGPTSFWIDAADRVYFLATDAVIAADSGNAVGQLFPPERFPQGFAPPEAFAPHKHLDHVSDLYSWATLAYYLTTGESPAQLAIHQRSRAATFTDQQVRQLTVSLSNLPRTDIDRLKAWLSVTGDRFAKSFPSGFVTALTACLQADRQSRPSSVIAFRDHCTAPPPPRVPLAIAVNATGTNYQLRFATSGWNGELQLVVRSSPSQSPINPNDGTKVYEGPVVESLTNAIPKNQQDVRYVAFVGESVDGRLRHSSGTELITIEGSRPQAWLDYVETLADSELPTTNNSVRTNLPVALQLFSSCQDVAVLLRPLFSSKLRTVQQWGVTVVSQQLQRTRDNELLQLLWDLGLTSPAIEIRLAAASGIFGHDASPPIDLVIRVAKFIGGKAIDDWIRGIRALSGCGLRPEVIKAAVSKLEADRVLTCSLCKSQLRAGDLDQHLRQQHGFIDVDGKPLSRSAAIKQLWDSVFHSNDAAALNQLADIFAGPSAVSTSDSLSVPLLLNCRSLWLPQQLSGSATEHQRQRRDLASCLRGNRLVSRACWAFLAADEPALRELGREVLMPQLARRLEDGNLPIKKFREAIDALCRVENLDMKIATCRTLAAYGASLELANRCAEDYELDRPRKCSICEKSLPQRELPSHERLAHDCCRYGGQSWSWRELVHHLCQQLVISGQPSLSDVQLCADILLERVESNRFHSVFAERLVAAASSQNTPLSLPEAKDSEAADDRAMNIQLAGSTLAQLPTAVALSNALFLRSECFATELALAICGSQAVDSTRELLQGCIAGLRRKDVAQGLRRTAVVAIVREFTGDPGVLRPVLIAYVHTEPNKLVGIKQLNLLRTEVGELAVIDELCDELEAIVRLRCPHCQAVMSGLEMRAHAELVHRRVWKHQRLNDPWALAEQCLDDYLSDPKPDQLVTGESYAALADGEEGVERFYRKALRRHIDVARYQHLLEERAKAQGVGLCRNCWSRLPSPDDAPVDEIGITAQGGLNSEFLSIDFSASLLFREMNIVEHGAVWSGEQPPAQLSFQGVCILLAALCGTGFAGMLLLLVSGYVGTTPFVLWVLGSFGGLVAAWFYRSRKKSPLTMAWRNVVPELLKRPPTPQSVAFLTGLAKNSIGRGDLLNEKQIGKAAEFFLHWFQSGAASHAQVAMVYQLALSQHVRAHRYEDAVSMLFKLFELWMDEVIPSACLDLITTKGQVLQQLPSAEATLLRWKFLRACSIRRYSQSATLELARRISTFHRLFTWPSPLPPRMAELSIAIQANERGDLVSIFDLAERGNAKAVEWAEKHHVVAEAAGGDIRVQSEGLTRKDIGLFVKGILVTRQPTMSITVNKQFVQTGWTHQRVDGGPDLRFNSNPPLGYFQIVDYSLTINGHEFRYTSDPAPLKELIHRCATTYFDRIVPALNFDSFIMRPPLGHSRVCCPSCGTWSDAAHEASGSAASQGDWDRIR